VKAPLSRHSGERDGGHWSGCAGVAVVQKTTWTRSLTGVAGSMMLSAAAAFAPPVVNTPGSPFPA
jgi:hypothetical protein